MNTKALERTAVLSLLAGVIVCCYCSEAQAIRYELIDGGGGYQGNYALSGFIDFDVPCGTACTATNITGFAFSVSGPTSYSYSYQRSADVYLDVPQQPFRRFLNAGPADLRVDYSTPGTLNLGNSNDGSPYLRWARIFDPEYSSAGPNFFGGWKTGSEQAPAVHVIGTAIPEPTACQSILLVSFAASSVSLRLHRRFSHR